MKISYCQQLEEWKIKEVEKINSIYNKTKYDDLVKQLVEKEDENKMCQENIRKLVMENKKMKELVSYEREAERIKSNENKSTIKRLSELEAEATQKTGEIEFGKQEKKELIENLFQLEKINQEYKDEINKMKIENNKIINQLKTQLQQLNFELIREKDNHQREIERVGLEFDKKQFEMMLSKPLNYNYIPYNANISMDNNNIQIIQPPSHEIYKVTVNSDKSIDNIAPRDVSPLQKYIPFSTTIPKAKQAQSGLKLIASSKTNYTQPQVTVEGRADRNEIISPLNAEISPIVQMESPETDLNKETTPQAMLTKIEDFIVKEDNAKKLVSEPEPPPEEKNKSSSESSGLNFTVNILLMELG